MKKGRLLTISVGIIVVLLIAWSTAMAAGHTRTLTGHISAIDPAHSTVVVEVPVGDQKLTVGGPLAENAQLRKAGSAADLKAFQVGDRVSVSWQRTDKGIFIHRLVSGN